MHAGVADRIGSVPCGHARRVSGLEDFASAARDLEHELEVNGIALGVDWNDAGAVRVLAAESLRSRPGDVDALLHSQDPAARAKGKIFALASLMLTLMARSATVGVHTHGGCAWKAFGQALFAITGARDQTPSE